MTLAPALLNGSGSRDRGGLPAEPAQPARADSPALDPDLVTELVLRVLGVGRSGRSAERPAGSTLLTELGLTPLTAVRLRRTVLAELGRELSLAAVAAAGTLAELCAVVRAASTAPAATPSTASSSAASAPTGSDVARARPAELLPLTPTQVAYWTGRDPQLPLGGVATYWYHEYERVLTGDVSAHLRRVEDGWRRLIDHHAALRLEVTRDGQQQLRAQLDWSLEQLDLRTVPDPVAAAERVRADRSHRVLTADGGPLFRVEALLLPQGRVRLLVGFDALAVDLTSWRLLLRQWQRLVVDPGAWLEPVTVDPADLLRSLAAPDPDAIAEDRRWWAGQAPTLPPAPELAGPGTDDGLAEPRRFRRYRRRLPAAVWAAVRAHAAQAGATPTGTVLAAFTIALDRFGAGGARTVATTLSGRPPGAGAQATVGEFARTTLLALPDPALGDGTDFRRIARDCTAVILEALTHSSLGAAEVTRVAGRGTGSFPVVFTSGLDGDVGQGDQAEPSVLGDEIFGVSQTPQVLLDQLVWVDRGELVLTTDAVEAAFAPGVVDGLADAVAGLIASVAEAAAWDDPVLGWDPTGALELPLDSRPFGAAGPLLADPARCAARRDPQALAVATTQGTLGHGELHRRADAVATRLRGAGVRPGTLVIVSAAKSVAQVVAVLGVQACGAGFVPVDPQWPRSRLEAVVQRSGAALAVVVTEPGEPVLPPNLEGLVDVVRLDPQGTPVAGQLVTAGGAGGAADRAAPDDVAYVIFTSGSTGVPKGVAETHAQARTTIDDVVDRFRIGPGDRVLGLSALTFDLSIFDLFGVLGAGGGLVLPTTEQLRDPGAWAALVERCHVTVWNSAPALLEMLVEHAEHDPVSAARLASLRLVMLSGDWIPVTLPDRLRALVPGAEVHSLGGATEASIWSITYPVGAVDPSWPSIPYGRALRGQTFHVLDDAGSPCRVGVPGELFIGGDAVAAGYVGDPEQTAARFVAHPRLGRRLYRTGDLGSWRPDGTIEFLGRVDRQVKIQGFRIELGEVEAALARCTRVRQAIAASVPGPDGRPRLVAWVATSGLASDPTEAAGRLREEAAAQLPSYMLPSRIVVLPALPVTANGKVDHQALPAPFPVAAGRPAGPTGDARGSVAAADVARGGTVDGPVGARVGPGNDQLHAVAREVLGEQVRLDQPLIAGGASSLDAVRFANAIEDLLGRRPSLRDLLGERPLAELLAELAADPARSAAPASLPVALPVGVPSVGVPSVGVTPAAPAPRSGCPLMPSAAVTMRVAGPARPTASELRELADWVEAIQGWGAEHRTPITLRWAGGLDVEVEIDPAPPTTVQPQPPTTTTTTTTEPAPAPVSEPPADDTFPLTEMQLAYLVGRADPWLGGPVAPHYATEVDLPAVEPARLQEAVDALVGAHPMLRARATDDARQRVLSASDPQARVLVTVDDVRSLSPADRAAALERLRAERSHRVVDPAREPGLHLGLTRLDDRTSRLHLDLDLLFCDAASAVIVVDDLRAMLEGTSPRSPGTTFESWVREIHGAADAPRRHRALAHWSARVDELPPPPELPCTVPVPGGPLVRRREHRVDGARWAAAAAAVGAAGVTTTSALLAALADTLHEHCRRPDGRSVGSTVVVTVFDRPPAHAGVVGDYTSTMLVGLQPPGDRSPRERARSVQEVLLADLEHSTGVTGVHGNHVLRELARRGRPTRFPVAFSSGIGSTTGRDGTARDAGRLLDPWGSTVFAISQTPQVLLDVQVFEAGSALVVRWDAVEGAFEPGWLDTAFAMFTRRVEEMATAAGWQQPDAVPDVGQVRMQPAHARSAGAAVVTTRTRILDVLAELLGVRPTDLDPSAGFFELGASSLTLVAAQGRLTEVGEQVAVMDFFTHPSPDALAGWLDARG